MQPGTGRPGSEVVTAPAGRVRDERLWRVGVVFAVAVAVHGADHLRRGMDVVTAQVTWAGSIQFALAAVALLLVYRGHPWAPSVAVAVGFAGAAGFAAAHLLPHWGSFSDSFTGSRVAPHVTALSWATAIFEIGADVAFGWAGLRALDSEGRHVEVAVTSASADAAGVGS